MTYLTLEAKQAMKERHLAFTSGKIHSPTLEEVQIQFDTGVIDEKRSEWLCYLWDLRPQDKERNIAECLDFASIPGF